MIRARLSLRTASVLSRPVRLSDRIHPVTEDHRSPRAFASAPPIARRRRFQTRKTDRSAAGKSGILRTVSSHGSLSRGVARLGWDQLCAAAFALPFRDFRGHFPWQ